MGTFTWRITVAGLKGESSETLEATADATVDTGAFFTMLPGNLLRDLRVEQEDTVELELADRRVVERASGTPESVYRVMPEAMAIAAM